MTPELVALHEVAEVGPREPALSGDAPFIPMDAVAVGLRFPTYTERRGKRGGIRAKANDVLFARITPCLENGKVAQLPADAPPTGGSTEFLVLRPGPRLDPAFLYYWSLAPGTRDRAQAKMTGTTGRMRLSGKEIATFPIPVFKLGEQRRIVEILEDHLSRLDAAANYASAAFRRAAALSDSTLAALFASVEGDAMRLGHVANWSSGGTPKARVAAYYENGEIPWCNSGDLNNGHLTSVPNTITELGLKESAARWVPAGTVLVAMYGATIGRVAITDFPLTTNQAIAAAQPKDGVITVDYLFWFLRSQLRLLRSAGKGGAQPNISQTVLKQWPVAVPCLDRQAAIAAKASETELLAVRLQSQTHQVQLRSASLRRAVLAAAFSGRLTGRHTDDEVIEEMAQ